MSENVPITVRFADENQLVEFPAEAITISVPLTPLGDRRYRLDAVPIGVESAAFRDVIEAEPIAEGRLRFVRIAGRSGWRTYDFILPAHKIDSELGQSLLEELVARGGHWERVFGGLMFVCVPPELEIDPTEWFALI